MISIQWIAYRKKKTNRDCCIQLPVTPPTLPDALSLSKRTRGGLVMSAIAIALFTVHLFDA
jgi:hypothetical protein